MLINIDIDLNLIHNEIKAYTSYISNNNVHTEELATIQELINNLKNAKDIRDFLYQIKTGIYKGCWSKSDLKDYCGLEVEEYDSFLNKNNFNSSFRENFGVADNIEQVLEHYPELLESKDSFIVIFSDVYRKDQPKSYGFRYEKFGEYIGTQDIQHEFIYDDKHIDKVIIYHIFKILN